MTIYDSNNQAVLTVEVSDESYAYNEIMGDKRLHLEFELPTFVEIPVGSYVTFHYETYYLLKPESLKLVHRRNWEYVVEFEGMQEVLKTLVYQNPDDHRVEFPVTGKAQDHLDLLVRCINSKSNGWTATADSSLTLDKCINYSFNNCKEALQAIADAFETEWEVVGKAIYVRKVEYNSSEPISMSYGKGNGLRTGIERKNYNDEIPLTTIYIKGDDRNIGQYVGANNQTQTYDGKTLHLPKSATGGYDGTKFSWETGYVSTGALSFAVSADGYSVYDTEATGRNEGILDCTDIYPKYEGTVTKVDTVDASKNLYDFYDSAANCPNFANLATSETMTVIFQSGMLAGREFDVNCKGSTTDGIHFEIVPVEQDTLPMPGGTFVPSAGTGNNDGDKYIIYHCKLPYQYINDATNHAGAEWDMLKTAVKYLYEARNPRYAITGELDGNWSSSRWSLVGQKIKCGGYISFTDPSFQTDPFLIRIQSVKHFVNKQFKPVITLANTPTKASVASQIRSIERDNFGNELQINDSRQFTKRTFASAKATMDALAEFFEDYSDAIKPIGIQTMQMIVGDERLQTEFSRNASDFLPKIAPPVYWDAGLVCGSGTKAYVRNQNIDDDCEIITTISGAHKHYQWPCKSETLTTDAYGNALVDNKQYYLYLYATKNNNGNNSTAWKLFPVGEANSVLDFYDSARGQYNFFVGILNMMEDETRQFVPVCGFTEITPGGITTDMIRSSQGNSWLNLLSGTFSWGNIADTTSDNFRGMSWNGNTFKIRGDVEITSGSGLQNLEGYNNLATQTQLSDLQLQVDGKIDTYHQSTDPATWPSEDNPKHVGDLWSDSNNNNIIKRYRYYSNNNTYGWESLRDEDIPNALALASAKRRVFTTTPNPPYDVNDLWLNSGKLYVCVNAKAEGGSYSASDWEQGLLFDVNDKLEVQREWQKIHGAANTNGNPTSAGSYMLTKSYLQGTTEATKLTYGNYVLTYGSNALVYYATGSSGLDSAYTSLKGYLNSHGLYDGSTEWANGYSADELTALLIAYYSEEKKFELSNVSDLEYLKSAMPSGVSTEIGGGVVLSSLMAVKDANGYVVAGMNGAADRPNWPMLWGGSTSASDIETAKWRVDKEGNQVNGTAGAERIEIVPKNSQVTVYDASGIGTVIIDGKEYDPDSDVFGSDGSVSLTAFSASLTQTDDGPFNETFSDTRTTVYTEAGTLSFPTITLSGSVTASSGTVTLAEEQNIVLKVDGVKVASYSFVASSSATSFSTTITGAKVYVQKGTHTVTLEGSLAGSSTAGNITMTVSVAYGNSGNATLIRNQRITHVCANGLITGCSNLEYLVAEVGSNNKMNFEARSGNAGMKVNDGLVQIMTDGTNWRTLTIDNSNFVKVS